MITGDLKSKVDAVWTAFWTGGLSNPLNVIEQMTYLLFLRRLDELQTAKEKQSQILGKPLVNPIYQPIDYPLRWSRFKEMEPEAMFDLLRRENGAFDFLKKLSGAKTSFTQFLKGATFMISTPRLLAQVVGLLDAIPMADRDTKGDVYEYLLGKIATAGTNGQFRTPRHIIKMMVEMLQPQLSDTIAERFLVHVSEIKAQH